MENRAREYMCCLIKVCCLIWYYINIESMHKRMIATSLCAFYGLEVIDSTITRYITNHEFLNIARFPIIKCSLSF